MKKNGAPYSLLRRTLLLCTATLAVFLAAVTAVSFTVSYSNAERQQDKLLRQVVGILSRDLAAARLTTGGKPLPDTASGGFVGPGSTAPKSGGEAPQSGFYGPGSPDYDPALPDLAALAAARSAPAASYDLDPRDTGAGVAAGDVVTVRLLHGSGEIVPVRMDRPLRDGAHTVEFYGRDYRVYLKTLTDGTHVAAAQRISERNEEIMEDALRSAAPLLLLSPIILIVLALVMWRALSPLARTSEGVNRRSPDDLTPIDAAGLPREIASVIEAINRLLARVDKARTREKRFIADAAHELRSPVTALSLQAERLAAMDLPEEAAGRAAEIWRATERTAALTSRLLELKRAEAGADAGDGPGRCSAASVVSSVVGELFWDADEKGVEMAAEGLGDGIAWCRLSEADLRTMLRNVAANAVRHTPRGGTVTMALEASPLEVTLIVSDTGPGIPEEERSKVFAPFYRTPGSAGGGTGLGLAIVRAVAERTGSRVCLEWADDEKRTGLSVRIAVPRADSPA